MPESDATDFAPAACRAILEGIQDAIIATDPDGTVVYMNGTARSLYGSEEQTGTNLESLNLQRYALETFEVRTLDGAPVADDDRPLMRALRGESYSNVELLVRHQGEGDPRVFAFSGRRVDGDPPLGVVTIRDETDRYRSERRYRVAFETDPAPSVVARLVDARILQANEGMMAMTDIDVGELIGSALVDLDLLAQDGDLKDALELLRQGERIHKVQTTLDDAAGNDVDVLLSARAIEIDGEACGIFTFIEIGDLERTRREHQQAQRDLAHARNRLAEQREHERMRLARDLHDGVLQNLLALSTEAALEERRHREAGYELAAAVSRRYRERTLQNAVELRRVIRGFRPTVLRELGLWESLREAIPDDRRPGDPEIVLPRAANPELPEETLLVLYRVAREAIHNAVRHARAARVEVGLELLEDELVLRIEDDGRGFDVPARLSQLERQNHFGLIGMEERAAAHNGRLEVASMPGEGTRIVCRIPLGERSAGSAAGGG